MITLTWTYEVITREDFMAHYGIPLGEEILFYFDKGMKKLLPNYTGHITPNSLIFYHSDDDIYGVLWDDGSCGNSRHTVSLWGYFPYPYPLDVISLVVFAEALSPAGVLLGANKQEILRAQEGLNAIVSKYHYDVEHFGD